MCPCSWTSLGAWTWDLTSRKSTSWAICEIQQHEEVKKGLAHQSHLPWLAKAAARSVTTWPSHWYHRFSTTDQWTFLYIKQGDSDISHIFHELPFLWDMRWPEAEKQGLILVTAACYVYANCTHFKYPLASWSETINTCVGKQGREWESF